MSSLLSIHRPDPPPSLLVRPNYDLEERPRLFCGWWPHDPSLTVYVYFGASEGQSPKWAASAVGKARDGKGDVSFAGATNFLSASNAWAPAIAQDRDEGDENDGEDGDDRRGWRRQGRMETTKRAKTTKN